MSDATTGNEERSTIAEIDKLVHEPARLSIMTQLYVIESADFTFVMNQTGLTRGNLSSHMSKLEEAGYIDVEKKFVAKKPLTLMKLTDQGRKAFKHYVNSMKQIIDDMPE